MGDEWHKTALSDLRDDPAMEDFIKSQKEIIETKLANLGMKIGITLDDLCQSVSGEVVLAWLRFEAPKRPFAVTLMADTRGRDQQREAMLKKVDQELRKRDAQVSSMPVQGEQVTLYKLPRQKGQLFEVRFAVVTVDGRVIISDRPEVLGGLVSAAKNGQSDSLAKDPEYVELFRELEESHKNSDAIEASKPRFRWFARPIQMGMIIRELADVDRGNKVDILKLLQDQGFSALRVAGGELFLATETYDILHHGYVLAPPTVDTPKRYEMAAAALQFPNRSFATVPSWVAPSVATLFRANWKMKDAFWAMETLVDQAFTQKGFFREMLKGFRNDPAGGIEIDVENDIVGNLGEEILILTENEILDQNGAGEGGAAAKPTTPVTREQVILAIRVTNVETVARVLNEELSKDKDIFAVPFEENPIWEVRPSEVYAPDDFDEDDLGFGFTDEDVVNAQAPQEPLLEAWAFTVFDGYLMISSHKDFLIKVIKNSKSGGPTLASNPDFQKVQDVIAKHSGGEPWAMERAVLTERAWRVKYHLIKQGNFLDSDSLLANVIRRIKEKAEKAASKEDEPIKVDFSKLPDFDVISKHLKPGGGFVQTTDQGWSITQFLLK